MGDVVARGQGMGTKRQRAGPKLGAGEFAKYHALGNDYVVMDSGRTRSKFTPARVRAICERHTGVGSDGILLLSGSRRGDFGVRIFNPDGSEAEKSGNGLRILARFLYDFGYTRRTAFSIETKAGVVDVELAHRRGRIERIAVAMGPASFESKKIPMTGPAREVVDETLMLGTRPLQITAVSMGNPHCVVFTPRLVADDLQRLGPVLEVHQSFPRRTNVQLACVRSRRRVEALIWERGAGETLASGSSSCAVAAAAYRNGLVDRRLVVGMRGGDLQIEIDDDFELSMTGTATPICRGRLLLE